MLPQTLEKLGSDEFDNLVAKYLHAHPPTSEDLLDVADRLPAFVEDPDVVALIQLEIAREKTFVAPDPEAVQTWAACEQLPVEAWGDVRFEISKASTLTPDTWVYRKAQQVHSIAIDERDAQFLSDLHSGKPFFDAGQVFGETEMPRALSLLRSLFDAGVVTRVISRALGFFAVSAAISAAGVTSAGVGGLLTHAGERIDIQVPRPENAIAFCYLSGSVRPTDGYGAARGGRAVRLRFDGTKNLDGCIKAVREHCRIAYLEQKAQIDKLKGYFFPFATPEDRTDFVLSATDCSATMPGPPKVVTH
jgi:hypothetical protein